ncbi:unnamed protein product [Amoebophrya sp. A120]|nr:unnamed protein product [Amoebophrya sp. A120]|eukprot:GSA120T00014994001.1
MSSVLVIGHRRLSRVRKLSEGGFAFVHVVQDSGTREQFALKEMACETEEQKSVVAKEHQFFTEKLLALEAAANRSTRGAPSIPPGTGSEVMQNFVRFFGFAREPTTGNACFLLEFCSDGHLLGLLEKYPRGRMTEPHVWGCALQLTRALSHLHSLKIQHRDLKIENVLVASAAPSAATQAAFFGGVVLKLCDFGSWSDEEIADPGTTLSKQRLAQLEDEIARTTTLSYRPPELIDLHRGWPISTQVDLWDLGCVLFMLCFGFHPFQDQSSLAIVGAKYRTPSGEVSDPLEVAVHALFAVDPRERVGTAAFLNFLQTGVREQFQDHVPEAERTALRFPQRPYSAYSARPSFTAPGCLLVFCNELLLRIAAVKIFRRARATLRPREIRLQEQQWNKEAA